MTISFRTKSIVGFAAKFESMFTTFFVSWQEHLQSTKYECKIGPKKGRKSNNFYNFVLWYIILTVLVIINHRAENENK